VSSRSYSGRHRSPSNGPRVPRTLRPGFALPTAAAAALVLTATGATYAESAPLTLDLIGTEAAKAKAKDAAIERAEVTQRRQQHELRVAAVQARVEQQQRAARDKERQAVAKKAAAKKAAAAKQAALKQAAEERKAREKMWVQPISGASFTSGYGYRWGRMHNGNDFATPIGTPLVAMSRGTVTSAGFEGGYGNKVEIQYWDGTVSWYAHMSSISVNVGESVAPGDQVGSSGNTGHSTGPHLHLEIHPGGGGAVNPAPWLHERGLQ
jgi:murein DD-endopeptidase MepM/ murein hydrolase activator NlpD